MAHSGAARDRAARSRVARADGDEANGDTAEGDEQVEGGEMTKSRGSGVRPERPSTLPIASATDYAAAIGELEPLAESVRYILARPQVSIDADLPPRIAVVSALAGEGVTTVSTVFASVLSHDSQSAACRVDLSWESTTGPGVYEVIMGSCELDDALVWNGPSASLRSGEVSRAEWHRLARSEELDKLIGTLSGRFEHVILDLPAILAGSDGLAMMRLVDAYLLVVKHGVTTLEQVQTVTDLLSDVSSIGSVLNQVRLRTPRPLSRWLAG